jgi:GxxExxY protein
MATCQGRGDRELLHRSLTETILKVFYEVYNELGAGFLESLYSRAMPVALRSARLRAAREVTPEVRFRGHAVGVFQADLVVENRIVPELKAAEALVPGHVAQLLNYLRATDLEVGLLLNFGPRPSFRRVVASRVSRSDPRSSAPSA